MQMTNSPVLDWIREKHPSPIRYFGASRKGVNLDGKQVHIWAGYRSQEYGPALPCIDVWIDGDNIARAEHLLHLDTSLCSIDDRNVAPRRFIAFVELLSASIDGKWINSVPHPIDDVLAEIGPGDDEQIIVSDLEDEMDTESVNG